MRRTSLVAMFLFLLAASAPSQAQLGGLLKSKPKPNPEKAPEYSEADKAKLAEIAQRPAIQEEIQKAWDVKRHAELDAAHRINLTATWGITDDIINHPGFKSVDDSETDDRLYSNPMMQVYVNAIGQRLVPKDSPNLYTFRILLDPLPKAYSLTTGSIYISTGLLSMLDSEAQLSYVLAHEVAHVEQKHVYAKIRSEVLERELNKEKELKAERTKALIDVAGAVGGSLIGAKTGLGAVGGAFFGAGAGIAAGAIFIHSRLQQTEWSIVEENEADEMGAKYMLDQGYDAREIPRLYASLDRMVGKDSRVGLGFMGDPHRVKERSAHIQQMLNGPLKAEFDKVKSGGGVMGSGAEFPVLLAAAKRDNGILAMEYDLFAEAKQNLEDALTQRSNDPSVHFYLSRVDTLTARTPEDRRAAVAHIADAIRLDAARGAIPDLHLEMAISVMMQGNAADKEQVITELKTYVALYQRDNAGNLPANMSAIFDYFNLVGETGWYLPPEWYPATQLMNASSPTMVPNTVVRKAISTGGGDGLAAADNAQPSSTPQPKVRQTAAKK